MSKKILIIGAGFLQDFVIRKAKSMGYITLAVDADPHAVGFCHTDSHAVIDIVDEKACLAYARQENIDGVLTAATDYGVLTAAYIAQEMGLPGLHYEAAKLIKNKYLVRKRLFEYQVDDTEQAYEVNKNTDVEALSTTLQYPVMVKPCDGSGSRGASRVDDPLKFATACHEAIAQSLSHKATVEQFVHGVEYGVESFVYHGDVRVLAVMKKWMTKPPYYAELGHAVPCGLPVALEQKVRDCAEKAIRALGINFGSVNMDVLVTKSGAVHIVDIGARMGGNLIGSHIVPQGTGVDYMANMLCTAVGDTVDFSPYTAPVAVTTRLLALTPGQVAALPDFEAITNDGDVTIEHHLAVGDTINEYHTNLDGCGYVVATGTNSEEKAVAAKEQIDRSIVRV